MNGYSRISHKSRSTDSEVEVEVEVEERKKEDEGDNKGERFGVILGRSASVSCSAASGFQITMKRAFSMRRSSSVSERYCRIHDQFTAITSPIHDHQIDAIGTTRTTTTTTTTTSNKNSRGTKILKACKRLLRL